MRKGMDEGETWGWKSKVLTVVNVTKLTCFGVSLKCLVPLPLCLSLLPTAQIPLLPKRLAFPPRHGLSIPRDLLLSLKDLTPLLRSVSLLPLLLTSVLLRPCSPNTFFGPLTL